MAVPQLKRVLHVIDSLGISGGAEQQLVANLHNFRDKRLCHIVAHLYEYGFETRDEYLPPRVKRYALYETSEGRNRIKTAARLNRLVHELKPDLLHCSLSDAGAAGRLIGRLRRVPVVESLVNISHERARTVDSPSVKLWKLVGHRAHDAVTMRWVERFIAISEEGAESWQRTVGLRAIPESSVSQMQESPLSRRL